MPTNDAAPAHLEFIREVVPEVLRRREGVEESRLAALHLRPELQTVEKLKNGRGARSPSSPK